MIAKTFLKKAGGPETQSSRGPNFVGALQQLQNSSLQFTADKGGSNGAHACCWDVW